MIYPQAGILWRDLYPNNFVDLDPGQGVRDFACGTQTYDGHTGTDSDLRSFREMDIGVPCPSSTITSSSSTGLAGSPSTDTCARGSS